MFCSKCGSQMDNENVCPNCGTLRPGMKYCRSCGQVIDDDCVVCPKCGKQIDTLKSNPKQSQIVINNENSNTNAYKPMKEKNKWVAFLLCFFLGFLGAHKFYEGKILMGILYLFTCGLFCIGWIIDDIILLCKPNPYYV